MVRFQAAFSLGEVADPGALAALAEIAARDTKDPWTRTAVLSSVAGRSLALFDALAGSPGFLARPEARDWFVDLAVLVGVENKPEAVQELLDRVSGTGMTRRPPAPSSSAWDAACNARGDRSATRWRAPTPRSSRPCSRCASLASSDGPAGPRVDASVS